MTSVDGFEELTHADGYRILRNNSHSLMKRLGAVRIARNSAMDLDDQYLSPISQTLRQIVVYTTYNSLDHLRLAGESLMAQPEPNPCAQASLIRAAIVSSSTSMWLLADSVTTRRYRALQYIYQDLRSYKVFLDSIREEPVHAENPETITAIQRKIDAIAASQDWAFQTAATLVPNLEMKNFRAIEKDFAMVQAAGKKLNGGAYMCWDMGRQFLKHYQVASGYAHGKSWATESSRIVGPQQPDGFFPVTIVGDPELLLEGAIMTLSLVQSAIGRIEMLSRCG